MNCPGCHKEAKWCDNKEVYGKRYGRSYMCYWCKDCDTYVGCHNNTKKALGEMADKETRRWRMKAHAVLDPLWKSKKYSRRTVYARISDWLGYHAHVSQADIQKCKDIIRACEESPLLNDR